MTARSAAGAARVAQNRRTQPNGIWGMALFLCAEVSLFGLLIGTYFYLDFNARTWPPDGIKAPSVVLPLVATGVLLAALVPIRYASRAARSGRRSQAIAGIAVALVIHSCYLALQIILFAHDLRQFTPQASAYGSIYFTLLGVHHAHVLLGLLLDLALIWMLATRGLTNYWLIGVRALALYWYVVGAVAVLVVLTQLAPSL
jgi:heme/copper-type cytochrome/quinol oxidase subunit 3